MTQCGKAPREFMAHMRFDLEPLSIALTDFAVCRQPVPAESPSVELKITFKIWLGTPVCLVTTEKRTNFNICWLRCNFLFRRNQRTVHAILIQLNLMFLSSCFFFSSMQLCEAEFSRWTEISGCGPTEFICSVTSVINRDTGPRWFDTIPGWVFGVLATDNQLLLLRPSHLTVCSNTIPMRCFHWGVEGTSQLDVEWQLCQIFREKPHLLRGGGEEGIDAVARCLCLLLK